MLVAFDFDGVLVESVRIKSEAFEVLYRSFGEDVARRVRAHHLAHGGMPRRDKIRYYHEQFLSQQLSDFELDRWCERFSSMVKEAVIQCSSVPGAEDALKALRERGEKIAVISATPESELRDIILARGWQAFFDQVYGFPIDKVSALRDFRERFGSTGEEIYIGDSESDCQAARKAGFRFIARQNPEAPVNFRESPGCEFEITDLDNLTTVIDSF